jgi:hypothetical protein
MVRGSVCITAAVRTTTATTGIIAITGIAATVTGKRYGS